MLVKLTPAAVEDAIQRVGDDGLLYAFADDLDLDEFRRGSHLEIRTGVSASVRISASKRFHFVPVSIAGSLASARLLKRSALWELAGLDHTYGVVHRCDWTLATLLMEFYLRTTTWRNPSGPLRTEVDTCCRFFTGDPALKDGLIDALVWP